MNREPISYYLKNPSKLIDISVNQIEKWLQQSPFSQPLRTLLAKKLHYNKEITLDPAIAAAATTAGSRTWLYRELYGKSEFKIDTIRPAAIQVKEEIEIPIDYSKSIAEEEIAFKTIESEAEIAPIDEVEIETLEDSIDDIPLETDTIDHLVEYEEVISINTLDQPIQIADYKEEVLQENKKSLEENIVKFKDEILDDAIEIEDVVQPLATKELKPIIATLDVVESSPKLIDLNQNQSMDISESDTHIEVVRVETDEEFVAGRDKKKKKSKKKEIKKKKSKKTKKKSDKKEKKKDEKDKPSKKEKKKKAKREEKERKKLKALKDFWDEKEEAIPFAPKKEKKSKKKPKRKTKKPKVNLFKYDIAVNPSEEEANPYVHEEGEISGYAQWLLRFSKDRPDGSLKHMTTASKKSKTRIEKLSFSSSDTKRKAKKAKKQKKGKKKNSTKAKNKSKTDHSLESNEEIISELWADLLAKQGHIKKARKMYLKLSLKYPEKSSYFAAKLDNL